MRLLVPALALATIGVLTTGVWLLMLGHRSDAILLLHKATFIAWGATLGMHFLVYLQRMPAGRALPRGRGVWLSPAARPSRAASVAGGCP